MKKGSNISSDEMLASFLEGNLDISEVKEVLQVLREDPEQEEALSVALSLDRDVEADDVLPAMKNAAASDGNMCSVMCEARILRQRGIAISDEILVSQARVNHWQNVGGTPLHAIGRLLAHYGLMIVRRYDSSMEDLSQALARNCDVMVVINRSVIDENRQEWDTTPNHTVIVSGVNGETVSLIDPSRQDDEKITVQAGVFQQVWKSSHRYMVCVLQDLSDYEPQPIRVDDVPLISDIIELREAIAENAHEVWAAARKKKGWKYGAVRDDAKKQHPDLVPYFSLSESEKEYSRIMVENVITLIGKLGFDIVKRR